jgi:hypothetical protein
MRWIDPALHGLLVKHNPVIAPQYVPAAATGDLLRMPAVKARKAARRDHDRFCFRIVIVTNL